MSVFEARNGTDSGRGRGAGRLRARGAAENPANRFERITVEDDADFADWALAHPEEEQTPPLKTIFQPAAVSATASSVTQSVWPWSTGPGSPIAKSQIRMV